MSRTKEPYYPNSFDRVQRALTNFALTSGALAIKAGSSAIVKSVNTIYAIFDGVIAKKAAGDMPAISGTINDAKKGIVFFTMQSDGTLTARSGGFNVSTLAGCVAPVIPSGEVAIGAVLIENGTGSDYVGGTTALDAASLTVTYFNFPFPYLPGLESLP
jgi:hypothetical protein